MDVGIVDRELRCEPEAITVVRMDFGVVDLPSRCEPEFLGFLGVVDLEARREREGDLDLFRETETDLDSRREFEA